MADEEQVERKEEVSEVKSLPFSFFFLFFICPAHRIQFGFSAGKGRNGVAMGWVRCRAVLSVFGVCVIW